MGTLAFSFSSRGLQRNKMWHAIGAKFVYLNCVSTAQKSLCMEAGNTNNIKRSEMLAKSDGGSFGRQAEQTENTYLMLQF